MSQSTMPLNMKKTLAVIGICISITVFQFYSFGIDFNAWIIYGFKYNFFNDKIVPLDPYLSALKSLAPPSRALFDKYFAFIFESFNGYLFMGTSKNALLYKV